MNLPTLDAIHLKSRYSDNILLWKIYRIIDQLHCLQLNVDLSSTHLALPVLRRLPVLRLSSRRPPIFSRRSSDFRTGSPGRPLRPFLGVSFDFTYGSTTYRHLPERPSTISLRRRVYSLWLQCITSEASLVYLWSIVLYLHMKVTQFPVRKRHLVEESRPLLHHNESLQTPVRSRGVPTGPW